MLNKSKIKIAVHNGIFHADDVLCVAMLAHEYGIENIEVVRTRDKSILNTCDYVLDVGGIDEITNEHVFLDHHQLDSQYYDNGVKMSACGKLAQYLYGDNPELLNEMRQEFLYSVEALDNGQALKDFGLPQSKFTFIPSMNTTWVENDDKNDEYFMDAVKMTMKIFEREIEYAKTNILARDMILEAYNNTNRQSGLLILNKYVPWQNAIVDINNEHPDEKILFIMYPCKEGWTVYPAPTEKNSFSPPLFPKEWAGLRDEELAKVSGLKSSIFCHTGRFIAVFGEKEDAIRAALRTSYLLRHENVVHENECER